MSKKYSEMFSKNATQNFLNEENDKKFLFDISNTIKHFYETPAIFLTKKDYSDNVFNVLCSIRTALLADRKSDIIDIIADFHLQWLHVVTEIENYEKQIDFVTRDEIYSAVNYTLGAISSRFKYYQRYMLKYKSSLPNNDQANVNTDIEIIEEMHADVVKYLEQKLKCLKSFDCDDSFKIKIKDAIEELINWIDKIYDALAIMLAKYININVPQISGNLVKTLHQIIDSIKNSNNASSQQLLNDLKVRGREVGSMIRCTAGHSLEIKKVMENIHTLNDRIARLELEPTSAGLMALQHKKDYLEKRLASLENLKTTLKDIYESTDMVLDDVDQDDLCVCEDFYQFRIFNHSLPVEDREHLVTELCQLWDRAVFGEHGRKSIISILSAVEDKEEFTDELGTFYIDEHSRKIYKIQSDENLYQVNEHGRLVSLTDDNEHIYFYDECGRYYVDTRTRHRVYKAHDTASEYEMDSSGILLKIKEERDGVTYYYDCYGRYYINGEGKHIYREEGSVSEYENDGLGNIVRIRSHADMFDLCPEDAKVTEDFKYLKLNVGKALRECIADVILHQPADPIKYLSACLIKYRANVELREKKAQEKEEFEIERELKRIEEQVEAERLAQEAEILDQGGSETSYDSNIMKYTSLRPIDSESVTLS